MKALAADLGQGIAAAAIESYERLIERGVDTPQLRYNLGTLHLGQGEVGRAVQHLRACLRAAPRHEDARFNLGRAIAARQDHVEASGRRPLHREVADRVSSDEAALKFFVTGSFASAILLYGIALLYGKSGGTAIDEVVSTIQTNGGDPVVAIGLFPEPIVQLAELAAEQLINPSEYISTVLGK